MNTSDGGFIFAGSMDMNPDGLTNDDVWIVKLKADETIEWQKTYGGPTKEVAKMIQQTSDGGFIVAGESASYHSGSSSSDVWVLRLDSTGNIVWQKRYGDAPAERAESIVQTDDDGDGNNDDGYLVIGKMDTDSTSLIQNALWAIKLDSSGAITWQKSFLGSGSEAGYDVIQTSSNGFVIAGTTTGFGASSNDYWLIHLLANGSIDWEKRYGGFGGETPSAVQQTTDNGFLVIGSTGSFVTGTTNIWGLRLDASTNINFKLATNGKSQATTATVANTTSTPVTLTRNPLASTYSATPTPAVAIDSVATVKTQSE